MYRSRTKHKNQMDLFHIIKTDFNMQLPVVEYNHTTGQCANPSTMHQINRFDITFNHRYQTLGMQTADMNNKSE